jgi:predicted glycogen debranching enzyme
VIRLDSSILHHFEAATSREWLETNGIGGFASSTVIGLNTRRYHSLLTAALRPPGGRVVLLSKVEETLEIGGSRHDLGTNQYLGAVHPRGYPRLESFKLAPFPTLTFAVEGVEIEKSVFMVYGKNTTVIQYRVRGGSPGMSLELRPLIAFRDYHSLTHENEGLDRSLQVHDHNLVSVRPYPDHPALYFAHNADHLEPQGFWYKNFEYAVERERGLDSVEDLFNPFMLRVDLTGRNTVSVIASTRPADIASAALLRRKEVKRRRAIAGDAADGTLIETLTAAADQYIVARNDRKTIIAGYPWFTDWGRDTMIALPGLTLGTGRHDVARSILQEFATHVDQGMLCNRFPDSGETPEYNTIDATLWYFEAVRAFIDHTGQYDFVGKNLYAVLADIIDWHIRGTRYGIRMDEDGLITSSDPTVQLTWMDAKIGDWVVTPRHGKAVEIQALWYNALKTMENIARTAGKARDARRYCTIADKTIGSFNDLFWNEEAGCLYDTVLESQRDATMRPNQIFAVSMPYSMLDKKRGKSVVNAVERDLLTPYGLRSLSPADSRYRGRYEGDSRSRDASYHQGTVWPWLLGPFIDAYVKVNGTGKKTEAHVSAWLQSLRSHLTEAGLGHISEIMDGDPPHHPRGCFAQAWSVGEILRVAVDQKQRLRRQPAIRLARAGS